MKEKLIIALLVISIVSVACSCIFIYCTSSENTEHDDSGVFVEIESHLSYSIVYDEDTRVIYAKSNSGAITFCPLYNADGTLKVYKEDNNERQYTDYILYGQHKKRCRRFDKQCNR